MHPFDIGRRHGLLAAVAASLGFALPAANAQTYPDKPVRLVVGYAPGTAPDVLGRLLGHEPAHVRDGSHRTGDPEGLLLCLVMDALDGEPTDRQQADDQRAGDGGEQERRHPHGEGAPGAAGRAWGTHAPTVGPCGGSGPAP